MAIADAGPIHDEPYMSQDAPRNGPPKADAATLHAFWQAIHDPEYCNQVMMFKASTTPRENVVAAPHFHTTVAGYFNHGPDFVHKMSVMVHPNVSSYIIPNSIGKDFLAKRNNNFLVVGKGESVQDAAIVRLDWLFLDFDPPRPVGLNDISATEEEIAVAWGKFQRLQAAHPELAAHALSGSSGNGFFLLIRLAGYPNDPEHRALIAAVIDYFHKNFDVDEKCKNPARLMCLPGTVKCKGEHSPDLGRPWRLATLDKPWRTRDEIPSLDLKAWTKDRGIQVVPPTPGGTPLVGANGNGKVARNGTHPKAHPRGYVGVAIQKELDRVRSAPPGVRNDQLNKSSFALGQLVGANAIDRADIINQLMEAGLTAGLEQGEASKTIDSGIDRGIADPRDISKVKWKGKKFKGEAEEEPNKAGDDPFRLAELFLKEQKTHETICTLRYWREDFYSWDGRCYQRKPEKEMRAILAKFIEDEFAYLNDLAMMIYEERAKDSSGKKDEQPPTQRPVTITVVSNVLQALGSLTLMQESDYRNFPCWIAEGPQWAVEDTLPTGNALIHLPSYAAGDNFLVPPTPSFFCPFALDYQFKTDAPEPTQWLKFLDQLWPEDPVSIALLQDWMGYLLTPDTRQQKIMMMIGPTRSGKGTILRVIRELIGGENVANPTLSSLGTNFGLAPLVGRLAAIISDARITGRADMAQIIERLLAISGEDAQDIDRKHKEAVSVKLKTRFMIVSNELPKLREVSGALAARLLILQTTESFKDREDTELSDKLMVELPGILLWAAQGWTRLRANGAFVQPESAQATLEAMERLSSPIKQFLEERCLIDPQEAVGRSELYHAWKWWCETVGEQNFGTEGTFGRDLRSIIPTLRDSRPRTGPHNTPVRHYVGLRILRDGEFNGECDEK